MHEADEAVQAEPLRAQHRLRRGQQHPALHLQTRPQGVHQHHPGLCPHRGAGAGPLRPRTMRRERELSDNRHRGGLSVCARLRGQPL